MGNLGWDDLLTHSEIVELEDVRVRTLGPEDHLRVLCVHWLGHGAWKPAGLCDIAAALEARPPDFDWNRCLGPDPRRARWVASTIALAQELLGISNCELRISNCEFMGAESGVKSHRPSGNDKSAIRNPRTAIPSWLAPAVLRQWDRCVGPNGHGMALPALLRRWHQPLALSREIYARWDNPVRATIEVRGSFNQWPRFPYQLAALALRVPEVPRQLTSLWRGSPAAKAAPRPVPTALARG